MEPKTTNILNRRWNTPLRLIALFLLLAHRTLAVIRATGVTCRDTNGMARLDRTSAQLSGGPGKKYSFQLGNPQNGTFADLASWADFYRGNTNYPQAAENAKPAEVVLMALAKSEPE